MFRVTLSIVGRTQLVALLATLLMGCATAYQPMGYTGGYSETQLDENVFQVFFSGNAHTRSARTSDFNLLRAADLTLERGFRYFVIVESKKDKKYYVSQGNLGSKPSSSNTIMCFKEKPKVDGLVFDAQFISKSIREKYGIR